METGTAMSFFMPTALGSYGIGVSPGNAPVRNHRVPKPEYNRFKPHNLPDEKCYVIDLAFPDNMLAIEYNGGTSHAGMLKKCRDESRRNDLIHDGWTVLFINYEMMRRVSMTDALSKTIARCLGTSVRIRRRDFKTLQIDLRSVILPGLRNAYRFDIDM